MTVEKETLGSVTTGIKAGGKIHGRVCFKNDVAEDACSALSGVVEFGWAAEPTGGTSNGNTNNSGTGNTDNSGTENTDNSGTGGEGNEEEDSAISMAAYGASFFAAISALVF